MTKKSASLVRIASSLFFLSGMAALIYEVIWFKRFTHVYGSSTLAQAVVVTSFLFGLALGAFLLGRIADRVKSPLGWYCVCEILIGVLALIIPYELAALHRLSAAVYPILQGHPYIQFGFRFVMTFLVIGPACVLMGGTLPLLLKHFLIVQPWNRETTGWLYAINTLGAAFGAFFAGFYFLPGLGMIGANYLAVAINVYVAMLVYLLLRQYPAETQSIEETPVIDERPFPSIDPDCSSYFSAKAIYPALMLTGCASLILQLIWTRQLALVLGGTTYAFSSMLFVFLLGIGLGSLLYSRIARRFTNLSRVLLVVVFLLILTTAIGFFSLPYLSIAVGFMRRLRFNPLLNGLISISVNCVLQLVPTLCMGFLFPLFVDILRWRTTKVGKVVGSVYTWNTVGSIAGTFLVPLFLLPVLGSNITVALTMSLYAVSWLMVYPYSQKKSVVVLLPAIPCMLLLILMVSRPTDPRLTNMGQYRYGYLPAENVNSSQVLYFKESTHSNVMVLETLQNRNLRVNGKVDANDLNDMPMQLGLAYYPRLFHPTASDVMIIGYGSGTTAGASLKFPNTKVTCCEIEPAVIEGGYYFSHVNHQPQLSPNFNLVLDDGRSYMEGCQDSFDLILSEPSNPWIAGISNLFTREFYQTVKQRLKPGGIFTQWIHTYNLTSVEYNMITRTLLDVFPHCALIRISNGDTLVLVSERSLQFSIDDLHAAQKLLDEAPMAAKDLNQFFNANDAATFLLRGYLLPEERVRWILEEDSNIQFNTDMNMRLEFSAPLQLFSPKEWQHNIERALIDATEPTWIMDCFKKWDCASEQLSSLKVWIRFYQQYKFDNKCKQIVDFALQYAPDDSFLVAQHLKLSLYNPKEFDSSLEKLLALSTDEAFDIGIEIHSKSHPEQAAKIFKRLAEIQPTHATVRVHLALCYMKMKNRKLAENALASAREIDPHNPLLIEANELFEESEPAPEKKPGLSVLDPFR